MSEVGTEACRTHDQDLDPDSAIYLPRDPATLLRRSVSGLPPLQNGK